MLSPGSVEALSMTFDKKMHRLEREVMTDIVRRIAINGEITRSADWQIYRLQELGIAKEDIDRALTTAFDISAEDLERLYDDVAESGYAWDDAIYKEKGIKQIPFSENATLQQYITAVANQTKNEMESLSRSIGFARKEAGKIISVPLTRYYQETLDNAINGLANGVFDYNTVLKRTVSEMTYSGIRTIDFESGRSSRIDVAVRRAVMTGYNQIAGRINDMNAQELQTDMFETTWHSGARPTHQPWQGRWYTRRELETVCGLGTVTGLLGANCYHNYFPVIPGISTPTYTDEQLEEMNRQENKKKVYGGKEYTKYEALQRQRALERTMRAQRQEIHLLKVGNAEKKDITAARGRYRTTSAEYTRFSEAMGLPQQRERVTIDGLGRV